MMIRVSTGKHSHEWISAAHVQKIIPRGDDSCGVVIGRNEMTVFELADSLIERVNDARLCYPTGRPG